MSDQGAIAEIGVLGNEGLVEDTGIEMPVGDTVSRKVIIPITTSMSDSHGGKWGNVDQSSGTIATNIVQERQEIAASGVVSKDGERLVEGLDGVEVGAEAMFS